MNFMIISVYHKFMILVVQVEDKVELIMHYLFMIPFQNIINILTNQHGEVIYLQIIVPFQGKLRMIIDIMLVIVQIKEMGNMVIN